MYSCKECGAIVHLVDDKYQRTCEHSKSIVLMDMGTVTLRSDSSLGEKNDHFKQFHDIGLQFLRHLDDNRKL